MTSSLSTDILIIGAGPTGLMLACQLSLYPNISFCIINKNSSCTTQSCVIIVHTCSLELLSQLSPADKGVNQTNRQILYIF